MKNEAKHVAPNVVLWGVTVSPYVRKVIVALNEKEIKYQHQEILPQTLLAATGTVVPSEFTEISPLGKIPVLQVGEYALADSAVIARYLDKRFTTGSQLYPSQPEAYAKVLWFEHYSDTIFTEVAYKKIFIEVVIKPKVLQQNPDMKVVEDAIASEMPDILDYLQTALKGSEWLAGDEFSMADVAITTQLLAVEMAGVDLIERRWGCLHDYMHRVLQRPSFSGLVASSMNVTGE